MKNSPTKPDAVSTVANSILKEAAAGDIDLGDIQEMFSASMKAYPEMLSVERDMLFKLNKLSTMLKTGEMPETEEGRKVSRYEVVGNEVLGRRALKDLQKKISETETLIGALEEVLGKPRSLVYRGDDNKPVLIPYNGRLYDRLLESLKKET